ncbi:MAG: Hsp33 family molecular chaperone HslO [Armatimonadetes bacterium]|nr:Hsp33 family molecular chaperone HslO [Armatimonadota bacterium]
MADRIIRGITKKKFVRFFAVDSTETTKYTSQIHNLSGTTSVIMGRLLSAGLMIAFDMKSSTDLLTLKLQCEGPIGGALVTANNKGEIKGYINNPQIKLLFSSEKIIDVKAAIGKGLITIIKDLGLKNPYIGNVKLIYGTIARDLTHYFVKSEQIPSSVGLGVLTNEKGEVRQSGGFIIQLMPDAPEEVISKIETNLNKFPHLTDVMDMDYKIEEIMNDFILKGLQPEIKKTIPAKFRCDCSKEKFKKGLKLLGKEELEKAISEKEKLETVCHFCNKKYMYDENEILKILTEI